MTAAPSGYHSLPDSRATRPLAIGTILLVLAGIVWGNSGEQLLAYLVVLAAAVLPSTLWIRMGAVGIPVFPIVALVYIPYFARPALTNSDVLPGYSNWEILRAALTVALFLLVASFPWRLLAGRTSSQRRVATDEFDPSREVQFALFGLLVGLIFHIGIISGWWSWLGSFYGLVRIVAVTFVSVALFFIGVTRAQGFLRGKAWAISVAGVLLLVLSSLGSLFLVGGIVFILAVLFGHVMVTKRIPWFIAGLVVIAVTVLHAGKGEMRDKYWESGTTYGGVSSMTQLPGFMAEWVAAGMNAIATGSYAQSAIERTSLLQMVLRVQSESPIRIDYLGGETYALLPAIVIPRFIDSDKPVSQAGMNMLNVRYGILTNEETSSTAIGWGLVAEAFANFGYMGVIGMGLLFGTLCGRLESWSRSAALISLPTLVSIAVTMVLINVEADFIQVCLTLLQSFAAVLVFLTAFRSFVVRRSPSTSSIGW